MACVCVLCDLGVGYLDHMGGQACGVRLASEHVTAAKASVRLVF
jgi:hypothetical protein